MSEQNQQDAARQKPTPEERNVLQGLASTGEALAQGVWGDVRGGATHFQRLRGPAPQHPVRQFFHGLSLPLHLLRALWADPKARRRYLQVALVQSLIIFSAAFAYTSWRAGDVDSFTKGHVQSALKEARKQERARNKREAQRTADRIAREAEAIAREFTGKAPKVNLQINTDDDDDDDDAKEPDEPDEAQVPPPKVLGFIDSELQFWAAVLAAVHGLQWVVIALSRDFHNAVSRDISLLTGLEPEDGPFTPRVRVDLTWLRNKFTRRFRGLMVFGVGVPFFYLVSLPFPFRGVLAPVLISAWSAYWIVVFTASKSAHAWRNADARPPWFLRIWDWLTTHMLGFRWWAPKAYGRVWTQQTRSVFSPAAEMEKQPWAFAGLALIRMLSMIPLVKCFLRPIIPVASAHLLVARHDADRAAASEASAMPAVSTP